MDIHSFFTNLRTKRIIIVGGLLGGLIGFLNRPAVPLLGQLPFGTVIKRGDNLTGLDLLLLPTAQVSFDYLVGGCLFGCAVGLFIAYQLAMKENGKSRSE